MKKHLVFAFFTLFVFHLFAQTPGPDPRIILEGDGGYDPALIRKPILFGENVGRLVFSGWFSKIEKWRPGAEIKAVVSGQPGPSTMPTDLIISTGATNIQERMRILENGKTGFNTSSPSARLSILDFDNANIFEAIGGSAGTQKKFQVSNSADGLLHSYLQGNMEVESGNLVVKNGKVGIGVEPNDMPGDHKLYVNGSVLCSELKVEIKGNWPDYVFLKTFPLMSLPVLEEFVNKEGHLPEVPSQREVAQNGVEIGSMQVILLQKIEELTLYILQQNHRMNSLESEIKNLREKK